jgi:hypothetical protein
MAHFDYVNWRYPTSWLIIFAVVGIVAALGLWAAYDAHANIPFISQVVCSLKGGSWHEAGLFNDAGCYARMGG